MAALPDDGPERVVIPQTVRQEDKSSEYYKHQFRRVEGSERVRLYTGITTGADENYKNQVGLTLERRSISNVKSQKAKEDFGRNYKHQVPLKSQ